MDIQFRLRNFLFSLVSSVRVGNTTVGFSKGRTISIKDNRLKCPFAISSAIEVQMSYDVQLFGIFVGVR